MQKLRNLLGGRGGGLGGPKKDYVIFERSLKGFLLYNSINHDMIIGGSLHPLAVMLEIIIEYLALF